jgi:pectate lyase
MNNLKRKKIILILSVCLVLAVITSVFAMTMLSTNAAASSAVGYGEGTTGGAGGTTVTVTSASDLEKYCSADGAYIIQVNGTITLSDTIVVTEDKTIIGVGTKGVIKGCGFHVKKTENVIIRNLTINHTDTSVSDNDAIRIETSDKVWVDHCTIDSKYDVSTDNSSEKNDVDGGCDIKKGSTNVTVSYCVFKNNWKNMLIGHSNSYSSDTSITVTIHHNWFESCGSRMPSLRFGTAHIYNNYYANGLISGINSRMGAETYIQNNYFENMEDPIGSWDSDDVGYWNLSGNIYDSCSGEQPTSSTCSYKPSYSYTADSASSVPGIVMAQAGAGNMDETGSDTTATSTSTATAEPTSTSSSDTSEGTYVHNFTTDGLDSDFFSITGNLSTSKGTVNYNNLTLTQCLKIESSTSIEFTTSTAMDLTLVFNPDNSSNIKVDGTTYDLDSDGLLNLSLDSGSHEITKKNVGNLYYMSLD